MRADYPIPPADILLCEQHFPPGPEPATPPAGKKITLHVKLHDYILNRGCSQPQVLGIILQLLTQGKVLIEFSSHVERLELTDTTNLMSRPQVVTLFDDFMKHLIEQTRKSAKHTTQRLNRGPFST
jgi:hypothetical protein